MSLDVILGPPRIATGDLTDGAGGGQIRCQ